MVGNLHEWTNDPNGTFQGGYYLDTHKNGDGCTYRTSRTIRLPRLLDRLPLLRGPRRSRTFRRVQRVSAQASSRTRARDLDCSTRLRPRCLASYMASSARRWKASAGSRPSQVAMPMETVCVTRAAPTTTGSSDA